MSGKLAVYGEREVEIGLNAVRGKYNEAMVQRMRNWPSLFVNYALAQNVPMDDEIMIREKRKAKALLERVSRDRDFALDCAEIIARWIPKDEWDVVPSVAQLRREWGLDG